MSWGAWSSLLRQLIIPQTAGPNDPAILIGPQVPPCMNRYSAVIMFRGPDELDDPGPARFYIGQVRTVPGPMVNEVHLGWTRYNPSTGECEYVVIQEYTSSVNLPGVAAFYQQTGYIEGSILNPPAFEDIRNWFVNCVLEIGGTLNEPRNTPFEIDGVSAPRGYRAWASATTSSGNFSSITEVTMLSINNFVFRASRAYKVQWWSGWDDVSGGPTIVVPRIKKTNPAGTLWIDFGWMTMLNSVPNVMGNGGTGYLRRTAVTDLTATVAFTAQANVGTGVAFANTTLRRWLTIEDCGAASDFAGLAFDVT